jgi:outer membrane cobalamin receptor
MKVKLLRFAPLAVFVLTSSALRAGAVDREVTGTSDFPVITDKEVKDEPVFLSLTRFSEPMSHIPTDVSVVRKEEIQRLDAKTAGDVVERLPSVTMTKSGTLGSFASLRMRGAPSSAHVQVLVDDLPLGGVASQFVDLSQIPVEDIDRIEVIRGGSSVLYGANTAGGIIHIITKRHTGDRPVSTIGIEGESFKTQVYRGSLGAQGGGFDGIVNARHYFTDGFQKNADGTNTSISGTGGYSFANGGRISVSASRSDSNAGDPQGTLLPISQWDGSRERDAVSKTARIDQNWDTGHVRWASGGRSRAWPSVPTRFTTPVPRKASGLLSISGHKSSETTRGSNSRSVFSRALLMSAMVKRQPVRPRAMWWIGPPMSSKH